MKYILIIFLFVVIDCKGQHKELLDTNRFYIIEDGKKVQLYIEYSDSIYYKTDTTFTKVILIVIDTTMMPNRYLSGTDANYYRSKVIALRPVGWTYGWRVEIKPQWFIHEIKYLNIYRKEFDKKLLVKEW